MVPLGRLERRAQAQRQRLDLELHAPIPPLARMPAEYSRQKTSCVAPVFASAPLRLGPSVRSRTTRTTPTASGIAAQRQETARPVIEPNAHGSGAVTKAPAIIAV